MPNSSSNKKNLTDSYICYLTPQAKQAVDALVSVGTDQDLAIATLEAVWPQALIYDIPDEEDTNNEQ